MPLLGSTMTGSVKRRCQVATQPNNAGQGEALWSTLLTVVDEVCDGAAPAGVGVGCGGPMQWPAGVVSPLNLEAWRDFPLRARVQERFPTAEVRLANDAIAMAIGEHWRGAGRAVRSLLGIVVSTGVGGGLVLNGRVVEGPTGNAGHVGHVVVEPDGPPCRCGGQRLSGSDRPRTCRGRVGDRGGLAAARPCAGNGQSLLADARGGDAVAVAAFSRAGNALGVAIASAVHLLELEVVAVGGGLSTAGDLLLGPARVAFARHVKMEFAATAASSRLRSALTPVSSVRALWWRVATGTGPSVQTERCD